MFPAKRPGALIMSNLQATVKAYATMESSPKTLCAKVNKAICQSIPLESSLLSSTRFWTRRRIAWLTRMRDTILRCLSDATALAGSWKRAARCWACFQARPTSRPRSSFCQGIAW